MHKRVDIKKNDQVKIITGRGKNMKGGHRVLAVLPDEGKVLVEGVRMVKRHMKPTRTSKGGILEQESKIAISNVMLICASCHKPTRIGHERKESGVVRVCRRCDAPLDK